MQGVKMPSDSDKLLCNRCIKKIVNEETKPLAKDFLDLRKEMTSALKSLRTTIDGMKGEEHPSTSSQGTKKERQKEKPSEKKQFPQPQSNSSDLVRGGRRTTLPGQFRCL